MGEPVRETDVQSSHGGDKSASLAAKRDDVHLLGVVMHNEGTLDGTSAVHRDIIVNKLGAIRKSSADGTFKDDESLFDTKPTFVTGLTPVYGDQKTVSLIRSIVDPQCPD